MSTIPITLEIVQAALNLPQFNSLAAQRRMAGGLPRQPDPLNPPRSAGVLALLHPQETRAGESWSVVLTKRNQQLRGHSGQVSFPGGKHDPTDASYAETALRETHEELGINPANITLIGQLAQVYIPPSNFNVYPHVGYVPALPPLNPNPAEVDTVFSVPLSDLLDTRTHQEEYREFNGSRWLVPYYHLCGHVVWGATAIMLCELEHRLRTVIE